MTMTFIKGMDNSILDEIEMIGGPYKENVQSANALQMMKNNGVNAIRLRICHDPEGGLYNLERTLLMAKRIKALNMHFLLDFHYSDRWTDPADQWRPMAWELHDLVNDKVFNYTYFVLTKLKEQDTLAVMVQIGSEINPGMLWNDGMVIGEFDTDVQWEKFTTTVKSGVAATKLVDSSIQIIVHIDRDLN